jgi:transcription initiation factor TFIIIB Brf1 subunit/transcription initiation factor TFIIB
MTSVTPVRDSWDAFDLIKAKRDEELQSAVDRRTILMLEGVMKDGDPKCEECKATTGKYPEVIPDHTNGTYICTVCGLWLEQIISEDREWREFADSDGGNKVDPNRVGGPETERDKTEGLSTMIAGDTTMGRHQEKSVKNLLQRRIEDGHNGIRKIGHMIDCSQMIIDRAQQLYSDLMKNQATWKIVSKTPSRDAKQFKLPKNNNSIYIACICRAYKMCKIAFTFEQFYGLTDATSARIRKATRILDSLWASDVKASIRESMHDRVVTKAEDITPLNCNRLNLNCQVAKQAKALVRKAITISSISSRKPATISGACIKIVAGHIAWADIEKVCRVTAKTIKSTMNKIIASGVMSLKDEPPETKASDEAETKAPVPTGVDPINRSDSGFGFLSSMDFFGD